MIFAHTIDQMRQLLNRPDVALVFEITIGLTILSYITRATVRMARYSEFRSYRVSFLGPPGSGKTTAIYLTFDALTSSDLSGNVRVCGEGNITRLQQGIQEIELGRFPQPTAEDSSNIYRFDYKPKLNPLTSVVVAFSGLPNGFRVELADFAGEHTDSLVEKAGEPGITIPDTFGLSADQNFLKWVSESDRCLLFIDLEKFSHNEDEFAATITSRYISFWQRYLDMHAEKLSPKSGTPVGIVFSKLDTLVAAEGEEDPKAYYQYILGRFRKLTHFLYMNSRSVEVIFLSALIKTPAGTRWGSSELVSAILPKVDLSKTTALRITTPPDLHDE